MADQEVLCEQVVGVVGEVKEGTCSRIVCHYMAKSRLKLTKGHIR